MQESLYQTAVAEDSLSDSGCRSLSFRLRMQETLYQQWMRNSLYQRADAGDTFRQRMQESLYQTADAEVSRSDSGCRSLSIRQRMQETLYQTGDAGDTTADCGRETSASAV